jgi:N-acyl-D-aspartate/D-glutamate deacylase
MENNLHKFFRQPLANENMDDALALMRHPDSCVTFSDSGAHVSQIMDSSLQTHLLSHWVRQEEAFTLEQAVRMITLTRRPAGVSMIGVFCAKAWSPISWSWTRITSAPRCPLSSMICPAAPSV